MLSDFLTISLSFFFFGLLDFFFFTIVDISTLSWYNGFILEVFLFFLLLFLPLLFSVYLDPLCSEALQKHIFCVHRKSILIRRQDFQSTPLQNTSQWRVHISEENQGGGSVNPSPVLSGASFSSSSSCSYCVNLKLSGRALLKSKPFKSSWHVHRSLLYSNLIIEQHREEDIT